MHGILVAFHGWWAGGRATGSYTGMARNLFVSRRLCWRLYRNGGHLQFGRLNREFVCRRHFVFEYMDWSARLAEAWWHATGTVTHGRVRSLLAVRRLCWHVELGESGSSTDYSLFYI